MNGKSNLNHRNGSWRRLFVVDIENVLGCGVIDENEVRLVSEEAKRQYALGEDDQVVVGVSHSASVFPAHAWRGARVVLAKGHNGADRALMRVLDTERVERRFDEVVLLSGDGIFAESIERVTEAGVRTQVRSTFGSVSSRLVRACSVANLCPLIATFEPALAA